MRPRIHPSDGRIVSNFIVQALLGRDITIYGDRLRTRSLCYADDLIDGLMRLMSSEDCATGAINPGNPTEFSILELASLVIDMTGRSRIVHRPPPQDDPAQARYFAGKAALWVGLQPPLSRKGSREPLIISHKR
jgi:UDP-glucuronate decarboxylase